MHAKKWDLQAWSPSDISAYDTNQELMPVLAGRLILCKSNVSKQCDAYSSGIRGIRPDYTPCWLHTRRWLTQNMTLAATLRSTVLWTQIWQVQLQGWKNERSRSREWLRSLRCAQPGQIGKTRACRFPRVCWVAAVPSLLRLRASRKDNASTRFVKNHSSRFEKNHSSREKRSMLRAIT